MTKQKSTKRALLLSALSLLMCVSMLVGSTFAWFTDSVISGNNKIQAGNLQVDLELYNKETNEWNSVKKNSDPIFTYANWEPGYIDAKLLKVENEGSLALKWKAAFVSEAPLGILADVIDVFVKPGVTESEFEALTRGDLSTWTNAGSVREFVGGIEASTYGTLEAKQSATLGIALKMREEAGNEYKNQAIAPFDIMILATQYTSEEDSFNNQYDANAKYPSFTDTWDGKVDTHWYFDNPEAETFTLSSAEDLAGLAALVDGTAVVPANAEYDGLPVTFEGKTIKLESDVDLYCKGDNGEPVSFSPIGDDSPFAGTFDGQGHTIENLYQSGWAFGYEWGIYGSIGLFGELKDATVKNLTIKGAESFVEGGDVGGITGSATGTCVFENITLEDSVFATYNNGNGGIIGWSGAGNYTFKNITIKEDVSLAGLWGSFDSSIGGIVGQGEPGATYNFENVDIACRLDVYNDCTASYDYYNYRMCGMIIGRLAKTTTIDGVNYPDTSQYNITCNDVAVTYGDWANYHYCEPTPADMNGGRGMRVEAGYQYGGLPADYDHSQCVDNHMNLIPFDQIFGGDQIAVKGLKAYDGVTVIYNNK